MFEAELPDGVEVDLEAREMMYDELCETFGEEMVDDIINQNLTKDIEEAVEGLVRDYVTRIYDERERLQQAQEQNEPATVPDEE
jgi:hypothetical protein